MDATQQEKIKRFMNDTAMSKAVHNVLIKSFLKPSGSKDVQFLAASRIAIDLLGEAWKDLKKSQDQEQKEARDIEQVGL